MVEKHLHIVSFNVPYPADYGGVIDIFYKLKALYQVGVKIHLHCFEYGRQQASTLENYCETVEYYQRFSGIKHLFKPIPYIVSTRSNTNLLKNLQQDEYPILFEGLHSTFFLSSTELKNRFKIVRMHNIEDDYYFQLYKVETNYFKKLFFKRESKKLKNYEAILESANLIAAISQNDFNVLNSKYKNVLYLPAFHNNKTINILPGKGSYILYHGNLSVGENAKAALFLVENVFRHINFPCIVAGKCPSNSLYKLISKYPNIHLKIDPLGEEMNKLISNAQINILPTFQETGIKLKLLNTLFLGRYCIVNSQMVKNTGLENLCYIADEPNEMIKTIKNLYNKTVDNKELTMLRKPILKKNFSNFHNAHYLCELLPGDQKI